ncbi:hypothetical protein [Methylobacterium sp. Gmos1]
MFSAYRRPSPLLRRELLATTAVTVGLGLACTAGAQAQQPPYTAASNAGTSAGGNNATAVGPNATAGGDESFAGGYNANSGGAGSVAIGSGTSAQSAGTNQGIINYRDGNGVGNAAVGSNPSNLQTGSNGASIPVNETTNAGATPSGTAVGKGSSVGNAGGVAIGYKNTAGSGTFNSTAIGSNNAAAGSFGLAIGYSNAAPGRSSMAIGTNNLANGDIAMALGRQTYAIGPYSFAQGFVASAYGKDAIAIGRLSVAGETISDGTGAGSSASNIAIGDTSTALGGSAVALGSGARASNARSVAVGAGSSALRGSMSGNEVFSGNALGANNTEFSVGSAGFERQITNVAGATNATDAVNLRQLRMVGDSLAGSLGGSFDPATGAYSAPSFGYGGTSYAKATDAIQAIDTFALRYDRDGGGTRLPSVDLTRGGAVGSAVSITGLAPATVDSGAVALSQMPLRYSTTANPTVANPAVPSNDVTLVGATGGRPVGLHNVAPGDITTATSTDAVNGGQLYATNQQVAGNAAGLSSLNTGLANGTIGLVQQDATSRALTVGKATDGTLVDLTGTQGARRLTGLASGVLDNDAVAFRQLRATGSALGGGAAYDPVTGAFVAPSYGVGGRSYSDVGAALGASNNLAVQYVPDAAGSPTGTVDLAKGGSSPVALRGVGAGSLAAGSTDGVNGGQLYATNQQVAGNTAGLSNLNTGLANGTIGLVQQDATSRALTVGKTADGTLVDLTGTQGTRRLAGLSAGLIDSDAATLGQLRLSGNALGSGLGGGAAYDPVTGAFTAPSYSVGGRSYSNVGSALAATNNLAVQYVADAAGNPTGTVDLAKGGTSPIALRGVAAGRLAAGSTDAVNGDQLFTTNQQVASLSGGIAAGTIGLLRQDPATGALSIAAATGGTSLSLVNASGNARTVTGVAAGSLAAGSIDAVNGGQLYATNQQVAGNTAGLSNLNTGLANGTIGLVQQDATSRALTVGKTADGTLVDLTGTQGTRRLAGLSAGLLDSDAATVGQLRLSGNALGSGLGGGAAYDPVTGAFTAPSYSVGGRSYSNVGSALAATNNLAVQYVADAAGNPTGTVDLAKGGASPVAMRGVAAGRLTAGSTDAVNGDQLYATNQQVAGTASGVAANAGGLADLRQSVVTGTIGLVRQDPASRALTVGAGTDGVLADFTNGAGTARTLTGVAAGRVAAGSLDAVNGTQLYDLSQRIDTSGAAGSAFQTAVAAGTVGLVRQDPASGDITVGAATPGSRVSLRNGAGDVRLLTGLGAGAVAATSTDAVTGAQLYDTNQRVAGNAAAIATNTAGLGDLRQGVQAGTIGLVQQDPASRALTVGKTADGTLVDLTGTQGTRRLAGLSAGLIDSDAATLGQLRLSGNALGSGLGGGAAYDPVTGAFTAPSYSVGGRSYSNVGSALAATNNLAVQYVADAAGNPTGAVDLAKGGTSPIALRGVAAGRLTAGSTDAVNGDQLFTTNQQVASLSGGIAAGTIGLLRQDPVTGALSIAGSTGGTSLSLVNASGGARTVTGVAAGSLAAGSTDAVNGGQLYATNQQVAGNTAGLASLSAGLATGAVGLVQQDPASRTLTVGGTTDGTLVDLTGTQGTRRLAGLSAGLIDSDAATVGQLRLSGNALGAGLGGGASYDPVTGAFTAPSYSVGGRSYADVGGALAATNNLAVQYVTDAAGNPTGAVDLARGGASPVAVRGVAAGRLAAGSTDAVNGGQLFATDRRVASLSGGIAAGTIGLLRQDQTTGALSIAAATGGTSLSLVNVAGDARTVTGVAAGSLAAGSTEAVNGGQLYATNQQVATLNTAIQQGAVGLVQQDPASRGLTVGAGTDGTTVAFADRSGAARTLTGIGAGRIAAGSQEGVNGGQIYSVTASLAASLGGGAGVAADGTLTLPRFTVQGGSYDSVGGALGSLDAAVTTLNTSGSRYVAVNSTGPAAQAKGADTVAIGPGAVTTAGRGVALGAGAVASRAGLNGAAEAFSGVAVASSQGAVSVGDVGAERQITNVAGATQDTDAVNLRQLRAVGGGLAGALGGGAGFSADGTFTAPSYAVGGQQYASVGAALGAVDTFGARYDVDPATGGRGQSMTLAGGDPNQPVLIRNVASGILPTDAANLGQVTQAAAQARADANAYTDRSVAASYTAATAYTDAAVAPLQRQMTAFGSQLADLNRQVGEVRGEARRSAAIGLAAAALRFDDRPGKLSVAAGGGVWRGESAASFGLGYTLPDGWARVNATGVAAGRDFGVGAGASFTLN